jgi:hypothetical protein
MDYTRIMPDMFQEGREEIKALRKWIEDNAPEDIQQSFISLMNLAVNADAVASDHFMELEERSKRLQKLHGVPLQCLLSQMVSRLIAISNGDNTLGSIDALIAAVENFWVVFKVSHLPDVMELDIRKAISDCSPGGAKYRLDSAGE